MSKSAYNPAVSKATRLRRKVKQGSATDGEKRWLADYVPGKPGRRGKLKSVPLEAKPEPTAPKEPALETDTRPPVAPEFQVEGETPAPDAPRVTPRTDGKKGTASGNWRDKYRAGAAAGEREATCVQLADLWKHALKKLNASIVMNGGAPAIPDELIDGPLGNCIVLTVDKLVPADFAVGPEVEAALCSSVVTCQAWWLSRKAKEKPKASKAEAAYVRADPPATPANDPSPAVPMAIVRRAAVGSTFKPDDSTLF